METVHTLFPDSDRHVLQQLTLHYSATWSYYPVGRLQVQVGTPNNNPLTNNSPFSIVQVMSSLNYTHVRP